MTVSASIPAAVMTVAIFAALGPEDDDLEANLSQTIASASTALATGSIFTLPALFLWGVAPPYLQIVALASSAACWAWQPMIPLRRLLIVQSRDELPYPEGTACAEVLICNHERRRRQRLDLRRHRVGAAVKLLVSLFFLLPDTFVVPLDFLPKAELAMEVAPP